MMDEDIRVGTIVYRNYSPAVVGTIIEVVQPRDYSRNIYLATVRVRWVNPKRGTEDITTASINSYERLVEDHERKASNHRAILERVRAIQG